jgi:hypothetical protein
MTWTEILLWAGVVALVLCPPKYDPAIRLKEYNERKRMEP